MNLRKLEFKKGYDKADFYARTGMFFAEKQFRKEMPYLINTDEKEWCLYYDQNHLTAFYAHESKGNHTLITGFYILENYRRTGITQVLLDDILSQFDTVRIVTCSQHLLKQLTLCRFIKLGSRGSYITMEWKKEETILPKEQTMEAVNS